MCRGRMGQENQREGWYVPIRELCQSKLWEEHGAARIRAYFSSSAKSRVSKDSSQPTSTRILIPPSSSRIDCEALEDDDCAPSRGVKVNISVIAARKHARVDLIQRIRDEGTRNRLKS